MSDTPVRDLAADQRSVCRLGAGVDQRLSAIILAGELVVFDLDELALCIVNVRDGPILQRRSQLLAPAGLPAVAADQLGLVHSWFALILARNLLAFPAK